jgi:hypothetical protein
LYSLQAQNGYSMAFITCGEFIQYSFLHYKTVFGHYRRWCKEGVWQKCWIELLKKYKSSFDLSVVNLDGSHSSCIRGGEEVGYQGRKKRKTTNALYLTDKQGLVLAMSTPVAGNHNDLFNIEQTFGELTKILEDATISVDGLCRRRTAVCEKLKI